MIPLRIQPVLYDLSLSLSGESSPYSLSSAFLQRLLFHTGFSCGCFLIREEENTVRLYRALGNREMSAQEGVSVQMPEWLSQSAGGQYQDVAWINPWLPSGKHYPTTLCLPTAKLGFFLLFSRVSPDLGFDLAHAFQPVLERFAGVFALCRSNESKTLQLAADLAEREAMLAALQSAKELAEQANLAKSEFLSRMSHELRTPMNAIIGFSQLLAADSKPALSVDQLDNVSEILNAGNHLLALINEVLDLARIESGRLELKPEAVDLASIVQNCLTLLRGAADDRQITFLDRVSCVADAQLVSADLLRLRQVLLNLLANAIKYNKLAGTVTIVRECRNDMLGLRIIDTGNGIDPDFMPRLFTPFERHTSAYSGVGGTGIGLALSRQLVEAMGGEIGVDSPPGQGASFWFLLPLAGQEPTSPVSQALLQRTDNNPAESLRILYIEDNPANLRLMRKLLAKHPQWLLQEASSAEEGITIAQQQPPTLILLDINLPGMNGFAAFDCLRQLPGLADTPIIAVTANAMERERRQAEKQGFAAYLTKPLDIPLLIDTLQKFSPTTSQILGV